MEKVKTGIKKILSNRTADAKKRMDALEKRVRELEKQNRQQQARIEQLLTDLNHRREAPVREGKLLAAAGKRMVWVIKCPAPDSVRRTNWGDYHFALALKKNLEKLGIYVQLDHREDWDYESAADVVLVLRGNRFYKPKRWQQEAAATQPAGTSTVSGEERKKRPTRYILWNISHPEDVSEKEYELYDAVCVASNAYAKKLQGRLSVPVYALLQCTDTEVFYPDESAKIEYGLVFVGNSREVYRESVMWAVEEGVFPAIWGDHWDAFLKDRMDLVQAKAIENDRIPDIYRSAEAVLNDHWADMRRCQFINNRIFDALACGTPVISDTFPELQELFPEAVLHYRNREEYLQCLAIVRQDGEKRREKARSQWETIRTAYSFESRAKQLVKIAEGLKQEA